MNQLVLEKFLSFYVFEQDDKRGDFIVFSSVMLGFFYYSVTVVGRVALRSRMGT